MTEWNDMRNVRLLDCKKIRNAMAFTQPKASNVTIKGVGTN